MIDSDIQINLLTFFIINIELSKSDIIELFSIYKYSIEQINEVFDYFIDNQTILESENFDFDYFKKEKYPIYKKNFEISYYNSFLDEIQLQQPKHENHDINEPNYITNNPKQCNNCNRLLLFKKIPLITYIEHGHIKAKIWWPINEDDKEFHECTYAYHPLNFTNWNHHFPENNEEIEEFHESFENEKTNPISKKIIRLEKFIISGG